VEAATVRYFQVLRRKRHKDEYEGTLEVAEGEAVMASRSASELLAATQHALGMVGE
jgi:hypothetical protein